MKKTGKALSLVLSLALVVSSLATTFASASAASETATVKLATDKVYLCNGGSGDGLKADLVGYIGHTNYLKLDTVGNGELYDHQKVTNLTLKDVAITGSNGIATLKVEKDPTTGTVTHATVTLTNGNAQGELTVAGRYEGTIQRGTNTTASNVYAQASLKVVVLKKGSTIIGKAEDNETDTGAYPEAVENLPKTPDQSIDVMVQQVAPEMTGTTPVSALASWHRLHRAASPSTANDGEYFLTATGVNTTVSTTTAAADTAFNIKTLKASGSSAPAEFSPTGTVSLTAQVYRTGANNGPVAASTNALDKATAASTITNKIIAKSTDTTISVCGGVTYLSNGTVTDTDKTHAVNVAGCEIDLSQCSGPVTMAGGSVGKLTTGSHELRITDGTVAGGIEANGDVTVSKGNVNSITIKSASATVTVNGGTVGDITDKAGASVVVRSTDEAVSATVGNIIAKNITVDSNGYASVKTGNLTAYADNNVMITLKGDKVIVGQIDCDYRNVTLNLEGFKGSIAAPLNDYTPGLNSSPVYTTLSVSNGSTINSDAVVTGNPFFYGINLTSGTLTFDGSAKIGDMGVSGSGTLQVAPNTLYMQGNMSGINLKMTKDFKVGDTVFSADNGKVYVGSFNPVGYTVDKVAASTTVDTFKVATVVFAGVQINGSKIIEMNTTENYVATPYPTGTSLPAGDKVTWDFSGNSNYLTATVDATDGNKIAVKAIKQDPIFSSLNQGTLTATVVDAYGFRDYAFEPVTLDVAIGTKPATFKSDTTTALNLKVGQQYTYKITSPNGTDPKFGFGTNGIANIVKSWKTTSGTTTFYYYTIQGVKEGAAGAFTTADKAKINVVTVKGSVYKSDTSVVTIATGKSYTFKITADKGASAPVFQVCTFSAKNTVLTKTVKNADGTTSYLYKVTANGSPVGAHGAYVNGVKVATVTVK